MLVKSLGSLAHALAEQQRLECQYWAVCVSLYYSWRDLSSHPTICSHRAASACLRRPRVHVRKQVHNHMPPAGRQLMTSKILHSPHLCDDADGEGLFCTSWSASDTPFGHQLGHSSTDGNDSLSSCVTHADVVGLPVSPSGAHLIWFKAKMYVEVTAAPAGETACH